MLVLLLILDLVLVPILGMTMASMVLAMILMLVLLATKKMTGNEPTHVRYEKTIREGTSKANTAPTIFLPDKKCSDTMKLFTINEKPFTRSENASTGMLRGANKGSISR